MSFIKNRIITFFFGISVVSLAMPVYCHANQVKRVELAQKELHLIRVDCNKIMAHEKYVAYAQKRYRYLKPLLTVCGLTCVLSYFYLTSLSLSGEEIDKIRNIIDKPEADKKQDPSSKDWFRSNASSIGGVVAVEVIGGILIIPPLSELIGKLTGSAHIVSSLELYDKEYTHCNTLITQIARDMQMNLALEESGKQAAIGVSEIVHAGNRLVQRIEKLLGFMRVAVKKFPVGSLRQEARAIEKRLIFYTNELCQEVQCLIETTALDYGAILALIVQFAQRYTQEMQRFAFLEQDARDAA